MAQGNARLEIPSGFVNVYKGLMAKDNFSIFKKQ